MKPYNVDAAECIYQVHTAWLMALPSPPPLQLQQGRLMQTVPLCLCAAPGYTLNHLGMGENAPLLHK